MVRLQRGHAESVVTGNSFFKHKKTKLSHISWGGVLWLIGLIGLMGRLFIETSLAQVPPNLKELENSHIRLNLEYTFAELERSLNNRFKDLVFSDKKFEDNNQDNIIAEAYKRGEIKVTKSEDAKKIRVTLPVRFRMVYKFDEKFQGKILWWEPTFEVKDHHPLQFDIKLTFDITPSINPTLRLQAETDVSFQWITYPYVTFYYIFKFRVTEQVQDKLQASLEKFARTRINKVLLERVDLKKVIRQFQEESVGEPFVLNAESSLWGVANNLKATVGPLMLLEDRLLLQMTFNTELDLLWDEGGYDQLNLEYPEITLKKPALGKQDANRFLVYTPVRISTDSLQDLLVRRIAREPIHINQGKNTMHVREIYIKPATNSLVIDTYLDMINRNKTFEILATVSATPTYVQETGDIELKNVDYDLQSESFILALWNTANKERLKQAIIENVRLPVSSLASEAKTSTEAALNKLSLSSIGKLEATLNQVVIEDVFMNGNYLVVLMKLEGQASVSLENLF